MENMQNKSRTKTIFLALIFLGIFGVAGMAWAATIYADNTLSVDCADGNYSIANRNCSGADGRAYNTIQKAINNMVIGDTILLRGGTYRENNGNTDIEIEIPSSKNGDSWEPGHYNTLASYPGEWAIIDGEGTAPKGVVLGLKGMTYCPNCVLRYWKFERLEITGGTAPGQVEGGAGLWLPEGPFIIRYNYFHDNWDDTYQNNPAGIELYRPQNSVIEYNYFYRNGCAANGNCRQIAIFNDYCDEITQSQCQNPPFANTVNDIDRATRKNIIRYNIFDGGPEKATVGLGYKVTQLLDPNDGSSLAHKDYGDNIHHNIFLNHGGKAAKLSQDYLQFHNNIVAGGGFVGQGEYNTKFRLRTTVYNNAIISSNFSSWARGSSSGTDEPFTPWDFIYNNIIDNSPSNGNENRAINYWAYVDSTPTAPDCNTINTSRFDISNNYIYRPQNSLQVFMSGLTACGSQYGAMSLANFDAYYGMTNFLKASSEGSDNLMSGASGADAYITRGAHVISGSTTIANGGIGGPHPYLDGVTLPSYVGATNPNDNAWVAGVLGLADVNVLRAGTAGDPSWIEGATPPPADVVPPSAPSGLSVQ